MENTIITIQNVRGYEKSGTVYLNVEDVARGLGFIQEKDGVNYVMWWRVNEYLKSFGFSTEVRKDDYIPENIFYRLAMKAKNETAEKFQALVADEILPTIRKHGVYATEDFVEKSIADPAYAIKILSALQAEREKLLQAEQTIEEQKPKVLFADAVKTSHTSILIGELAKLVKQNGVDIGQNRLFKWLRKNGYLIKGKRGDYNQPTQKSMDKKLFEVIERTVNNPDGSVRITKTTKVTGKGQIYFINKLLKGEI